jgi:hypothetical protein
MASKEKQKCAHCDGEVDEESFLCSACGEPICDSCSEGNCPDIV